MADEVRSLDLLTPTAPALSTTSDMPTVAQKPEPKKGAVSQEELDAGGTEALKAKEAADKKAAEEVKGDKKADDKSEAKTEEDADKKVDETPAWQKAEITKARNRQREAESRASALEARLDKALVALEKAATRTDTEVKTAPADPRPQRKDFDDPDKYEAALIDWSAKSAAKITQAEIERQSKESAATQARKKTEEKQQSEFKERVDAWTKAKTAAIEKYPDWMEVAESPDVTITPAMAFAMMEENLDSGKGFEIAYYLGKHPEEAAKIAALASDTRQELAIGRLAERLAAAPVKVTKVPDPPKPVGSRSSALKKSPESESMEEYATRRNAELRPPRANPH
jgi:hypothetical protein